MSSYAEGSDHVVEDFQVALPNGGTGKLLQFDESGHRGEEGADGSNTNLGGFSDIQDERHNGRQELVAVGLAKGSQGVNDLGTKSVRNGTRAGHREQTFDHRWQLSVAHGLESDDLFGVGLGILEGIMRHTAVLADGVRLAWALFLCVASNSDQVAESKSNGTTELPKMKIIINCYYNSLK